MNVQANADENVKRGNIFSNLNGAAIKKWFGKGSWAIADQGVYGLSSFLINVLLGTWVSASDYGAFAISFATLILILAFYNAMFVEPMLVFGARRFTNRFSLYLKVLLKGHILFSVVSSAITIVAAYIVGIYQTHELSSALYGLGIAMPFFLLAWLMRRACYVHRNPRLATFGGAVFFIGVVAGLYILNSLEMLSTFSAWLAMALGGLMSGIFLMIRLRIPLPAPKFGRFSRIVLMRHWVYSRWAIAARLPMRIPRIVVLSALPIWAGLEATGTLQALSNPVMPIVQVIAAVSLLLIPTLSRIRGTNAFFKLVTGSLAVFVLVTAVYWVLLGVFHKLVITTLYAGNYNEASSLLWYLGAQPVFTAAISVLGAGFSAIEQPKYVFWSYLVGAIVGLPLTFYLMAKYQLLGAVIGSIGMNLITTIALAVFFISVREKFLATGDPVVTG